MIVAHPLDRKTGITGPNCGLGSPSVGDPRTLCRRLSVDPVATGAAVFAQCDCRADGLRQDESLPLDVPAGGRGRRFTQRTLAEERHGFRSFGPANERQKTIFMTLGVSFDELTYTLSCGPPEAARSSLFYLDPEVKEETIYLSMRPAKCRLEPQGRERRHVGR